MEGLHGAVGDGDDLAVLYVGNLAGNPWPFLLMVSVTR